MKQSVDISIQRGVWGFFFSKHELNIWNLITDFRRRWDYIRVKANKPKADCSPQQNHFTINNEMKLSFIKHF